MIVELRGVWTGEHIDVNGVGYDVEVTGELETGREVEICIRSVWREGSGWSLYGFSDRTERAVFDALCKVARVGPTAAMSTIRTHGIARICTAIMSNDPSLLAKTPGVGKKTAELICGYTKLDEQLLAHIRSTAGAGAGGVGDDVVEALIALGYEPRHASDATAKARMTLGEGAEDEDILREALQLIRGGV